MEAAVLRVKRKRGADPADALILSCKRIRTEDETKESSAVTTQVFRLAATVKSENEPLHKYVREAISRNQSCLTLRPSSESKQRIQEELRASKEAERQVSRYRIISSHRPNSEEDNVGASHLIGCSSQDVPSETQDEAEATEATKSHISSPFQLFDMVQEEPEQKYLEKDSEPETILCNSIKMIREHLTVSEAGQESEHREYVDEYVYDIYYSEASQHGWIQDILYVQPYTEEQELVSEEPEPEEIYEDEDDENEENNWRNDYPDEEDSDREERYIGYYEDGDEEEKSAGHAWKMYHRSSLREIGDDDENADLY
ncbi:probable RNA polymerase II nuclear localization protein SLC7A6OS [Xenopus laevis]|uniref:Probable RNA polymerase II nuclear localization protein SLC7A6OS n=1 Tax=Xenopus laevis TaxID=8355 RepID=S7A6O_XENLA|nr:probable RNA polymerase II nuclear localization protein SLC7A6OS [Xenopus laevis]A2BDB7.1 RecName: Full=Probable RNA polymerase II nuclear localization protein SLC7A6OS; AltName: Full=Solute carrier family 7 member 6 opposite strand transcript homolog [Xenopus laevis]AAI30168.1 LOC100037092 protein [Xenopus laevis]